MNRTIDLRSDTCSAPDEEMREAIRSAAVGNESWGEDPSVNRLVEESCAAMGKEDGLFMASGTMANLVSLITHADGFPSGSEVVMAGYSHSYWYEAAGVSRLAGLSVRAVDCGSDYLTVEAVRAAIRPESAHAPHSALLWLENSYMLGGGIAVPPERMRELYVFARERGMAVHLDGARIFNAACALGVAPAELARYADTVQFCYSKGLGAPFGSFLCGSREFIERARRNRTMVGGGLRQAGIMASAALVALHRAGTQIPLDNRRARVLAEGLAEAFPGSVDLAATQTNIVLFDAGKAGMGQAEFCAWLRKQNILAMSVPTRGGSACRFVVYNGIGDQEIETVLQTVRTLRVRP